MKLGVVITDAGLIEKAVALMQAAASRGFALRGFLTDTGVRALQNGPVQALVNSEQLALAVCEHSVERYDTEVPEQIAEQVIIGGQYQDAELVRWCDRVVVF